MNTWPYRNWIISSPLAKTQIQTVIDAILSHQLPVIQTLKNTSRSVVEQVRWENQTLVLKHPVEKNRRRFQRMVSFFRGYGESKRNIRSFCLLESMGISTNTPWIAMEKRRYGMTIDSFSLYSYIDAEACSREHYVELIAALQKIHRRGFVHGDAHLANFLWNQDHIVLIDCNPKRAWFGPFSVAAEWRYLIKSAPDIAPFLSHETQCYSYRFACFFVSVLDAIKHGKRWIKNKLRNQRL